MTIGRIDINEKDLPKICGGVIQLEERVDEITDDITTIEDEITAIEGEIAVLGTSGAIVAPQGRLTLVTATPVMNSTQTGKTTIFFTPYIGSRVPIYTGTAFSMTVFAELSNITTASTVGNAGPAAVAASSVYDLFVWSNAGTPTLTRGPAWSNDTTRSAGTALVSVGGLLLNSVSITNGPAAQRGTYVGTIRSNGSSSLDMIFNPTGVPGGNANILSVYNAYNRVRVNARSIDLTASWTRTTTSWGPMDAGATGSGLNNRVSWVDGLRTSMVCVDLACVGYTQLTPSDPIVAIALDNTSAPISDECVGVLSGSLNSNIQAKALVMPQLGFHFVQALDAVTAAGGTAQFDGKVSGVRATVNDLPLNYLFIELDM